MSRRRAHTTTLLNGREITSSSQGVQRALQHFYAFSSSPGFPTEIHYTGETSIVEMIEHQIITRVKRMRQA